MPDRPSAQLPDLTECEREPIHIPGSIQPHGLLLALAPETMQVVQWSLNAPAVLGVGVETLPERTISDLVDPATEEILEALVADGVETVTTPLRTWFSHSPVDRMHLGVAHLYQGVLIVEYELLASQTDTLHAAAPESREPITRRLKQATARMQSCATMEDLYGAIAQSVRSLSGFDRVMVYRFLEDGHGEVVGEAKAERFESFFGLHYPATDIPPQARRLYTVNTLRLIADLNAAPIPIVPEVCPIHGGPLDLTYSAFRSVSPVHIEYLHNMGVAASMSISILRGGELWGLIACHHYSPRQLPFELRAGCELLGTTSGAYVATRFEAELVLERFERQQAFRLALRTAESAEILSKGLLNASESLLAVADAEGLAICSGENVLLTGRTPPIDVVEKLRDRLNETVSEDEFDTDRLPSFDAALAPYSVDASGMRMLRIGPERRDMLLFFRPEYAQEVTWAGNPEKAVGAPESGIRLSPRKSFAAWKQTVSGRSRSWTAVDREMTVQLRASLVNAISRRLNDLVRVNRELARINSDLNSFTYAASHDLKEPLRAVHQSLYFLEQSLGECTPETGERIAMLRKNTRRMDDLLEGLLRLSRVGRRDLEVQEHSMEEIAREAADMSFGEQLGRSVDFQLHPLPRMRVDYMCIRDLLCNLFSNAIKYNESPTRRIEVRAVEIDSLASAPSNAPGKYAVAVRDNGIGIAEHHHAVVFEVFRRLHLPEEFGGGTGSGLAIARKIVERHGGVVWLESAPGQGTTVYFSLPN